MLWRLSELKNKEVINLRDGSRLGGITDIEIDMNDGRVMSVIVPAPGHVFSLFGRKDDYVIPFGDIKKSGNDLILVEYESADVEDAAKGRKRFFK